MTICRLVRAWPDRISGRRVGGRHPEHRSERRRDPFHLRLGDLASRPPPELNSLHTPTQSNAEWHCGDSSISCPDRIEPKWLHRSMDRIIAKCAVGKLSKAGLDGLS
jgi:hypothetical protein